MSLCKSISDETQIYQYYKSKYLRIKDGVQNAGGGDH